MAARKDAASGSRNEVKVPEGAKLSPEQVARRAYELFVARGGDHGHDLEDWLQAERELSLARKGPRAP